MAARLCVCVAVLCLSLALPAVQGQHGKTWALLVASAKGWENYGMQADVFHAFQVIREGGIPASQIIVMAYDDIARSSINPFKGRVFQSYDMKNVYSNVTIDYSGHAVTKKTFLAVLQGDKGRVRELTGREGKVIDSGPHDNVFVFVSDHGGPGVICWLDGDDLSAKELNDAIRGMHESKRYKNMVLYIDTCFSGSMFQDLLPDDIGVYAVTSANYSSSAYSTDCRSRFFPGYRETCLGGLFSITWVYETESDERLYSTLDQQFQQAQSACRGLSTPKRYGDISIAQNVQAAFFGDSAMNPKTREVSHPQRQRRSAKRANHPLPKHMQTYYLLKNQLAGLPEGSVEFHRVVAKLGRVETMMSQAERFIKAIPTSIYGRSPTDAHLAWARENFGQINWACYEPVLRAFREECPGISHREEVRYYTLSWFGFLINLCNEVPARTVLTAVKEAALSSELCKV